MSKDQAKVEPIVPPGSPSSTVKPGFKTTEFWGASVGSLLALALQAANLIPPPWGVIALVILQGLYGAFRAYVKVRGDNSADSPSSSRAT